MKKIIFLALALSISLSCLVFFTSCEAECITAHKDADKDGICDVCDRDITEIQLAPKEYIQYVKSELSKTLQAAQKKDELKNMSVYDSRSSNMLVQFANEEAQEGEIKCAVLNTETGEVVLTLTKEPADSTSTSSARIYAPNGDSAFIIVETEDTASEEQKYETAVYTYLGQMLATVTSKTGYADSPEEYGADMWLFDDKIYIYRDGKAELLLEKGMAEIPSIDYASDKYFYQMESNCFYVYDRELKLLNGYISPANSIKTSFFVLNNGNVLIQNIIYLPEETEEYDLFFSGYKCALESLELDIKSDETEELELDFYVLELENTITNPDLKNESIKLDTMVNVTRITKIENYTFSTKEELVNLSNNLKTINYLANEVPMQVDTATAVTENRYIVQDKSGKEYLVDGKGKLIGEVTSSTYMEDTCLFSYNGKYYDTNLELVLDTEKITYERVSGYYSDASACTIYRESTDNGECYYVLRNGKMSKLSVDGSASSFACNKDSFTYKAVDSENKEYIVFCNTDGEELLRIETTSGEYISGSCFAMGGGKGLIIKHTHYNENGEEQTDYYASVKG